MKMEGGELKLASSTKANDADGLTFGPAWLRQLSSGDSSKMAGLPPSPGLAFQLAKHRYSREDMLGIFENIEKKLSNQPAPPVLSSEFEELFRKEIQRPILLISPSLEEQGGSSNSVSQGVSGDGGGGSRGERSNRSSNNGNDSGPSSSSSGTNLRHGGEGRGMYSSSSRGGSRGGGMSGRGDGGLGRGGLNASGSTVGPAGRGRGRGRGGPADGGAAASSSHYSKPSLDEEGNPIPHVSAGSIRGGLKGGPGGSYNKSSLFPSRSGHTGGTQWEDRESSSSGGGGGGGRAGLGEKKEYSRALVEDNWRNTRVGNSESEPDEYGRDMADENEAAVAIEEENEATAQTAGESGEKKTEVAAITTAGNEKRTAWRNQPANEIFKNSSQPQQQQASGNNRDKEWTANKKPGQASSSSAVVDSSTAINSNSNEPPKPRATYSDISKRTLPNRNNPEWMNDEEDNAMTFDEHGKFVYVKDLKGKAAAEEVVTTANGEKQQTDGSAKPLSSITQSENENQENETKTAMVEKVTATLVETNAQKQQQQQKQEATKASGKSSQQMQQTTQNETQSTKATSGSNVNENSSNKNTTDYSNNNIVNMQQIKLQQNIQLLEENLGNAQVTNEPIQNLANQLGDFNLNNNNQASTLSTATSNIALQQAMYDPNALKQMLQQHLQQQQQQVPQIVNQDPKIGAVPVDHPEAGHWFYMDPQNQIQGAFSSEQMSGWLSAGYFTEFLMIKRGCDDKFLPLGAVKSNWGRIPFASGYSSPPPLITQAKQQPVVQQLATSVNPLASKEQLIQQMQLYQQMQQLQQFIPQNFGLLRNELNQPGLAAAAGNNMNVNAILQQLQQLQLQQKTATAAANPTTNLANDLRIQQESLINQFVLSNSQINPNLLNLAKQQQQAQLLQQQLQQQQRQMADSSILNDPSVIDPAILGASNQQQQVNNQSIWGDIAARLSPLNQPAPTISPINNLLQQQQQFQQHQQLLQQQQQYLQQQSHEHQQQQQHQNTTNLSVKDKIQALFEQNKKEEENLKRRKLEEEYQQKLKREEEEKRRQAESQLKKEDELKRVEEERLRKEQQKKRIEELVKKAEEEKLIQDELKKKKEEDKSLKQKQKEEQKKLEAQQKEQQREREEAERKRQAEAQAESLKKQAELERQRQKLQQEQLNNLQLPAHAQWAKMQASQLQQQQQAPLELRKILEQQSLEQKMLMEQMRQAELANQNGGGGGGGGSNSWSSLFRGSQQLSPPAIGPILSSNSTSTSTAAGQLPVVSLTSIQAEQIKSQDPVSVSKPTTMSQKIQQQQPPSKTSGGTTGWAAWGSNNGSGNASSSFSNNSFPTPANSASSVASKTTLNSNSVNLSDSGKSGSNVSGGFWNELSESGSKSSSKQASSTHVNNGHKIANSTSQKNQQQQQRQNQSHQNDNSSSSKYSKKNAQIEESLQQTFLRNMTISEEFMKWCAEQLKDFHVELHIPTFVNFLREIETCEEIEDYVVNYLGESKQAKEFAQQFFINRESQLKQQTNLSNEENAGEGSYRVSNNNKQDSHYNSNSNSKQQKQQQQKKRTKGHKLDSQLLGFTVQADPNLKNRGDIDNDL